MITYAYSAAKQNGEIVKGEREAENEKMLAQILRKEELFLMEAKEKFSKPGIKKFNIQIDVGGFIARLRPISLREKIFFSRNLSVMVNAGISLTRALESLGNEIPNPKFQKIINDISGSVIKGKTFAEALSPHRKVFGDLYVSMVEVGETTGKLGRILKILAAQMKKDYDLLKRVKGAMTYPAIILIALIIIGILMMTYVVPTITKTLEDLKVDLPPTTKAIIAISSFLESNSILVFVGFVALIAVLWKLIRTRRGKEVTDQIVVRLPVFGELVKKINVARMCRTLSYMISSGVPIIKALEITSSVLGNTLYKNALAEASREIQKGKPLHKILEPHVRIFQPLITQMIGVGEETGKISSMLLRLALFFEEEVDNTTKNLSSIIEPLLMIIVGAVVGLFAISMLQPIYGSLGNI